MYDYCLNRKKLNIQCRRRNLNSINWLTNLKYKVSFLSNAGKLHISQFQFGSAILSLGDVKKWKFTANNSHYTLKPRMNQSKTLSWITNRQLAKAIYLFVFLFDIIENVVNNSQYLLSFSYISLTLTCVQPFPPLFVNKSLSFSFFELFSSHTPSQGFQWIARQFSYSCWWCLGSSLQSSTR